MTQALSFDAPILITGGTGFAGSHLMEALLERGYHQLHLTHFGSTQPQLPASVSTHSLDLNNREEVSALLEKVQPQAIFHLASIAAVGQSFEQAEKTLINNTLLQLTLLEAIREHAPTARTLIIGSAEEYGLVTLAEDESVDESYPLNPVNPYAVSKVTQDLLAHSYFLSFKLNIIRVRPFNHIGERQTPQFAIPAFAQQIVAIERGQESELKVGNLAAVRDFTDVKDMVRAYITLIEHGQVGEVYNVGSGVGRSMQSIVDELCQLATVPIQVVVDQSKIRPLDLPRMVANNAKISKLGWQPAIPFSETLHRILTYWREQL
jgi:GDP-4-dehydro-6-deoxy-D-mannose reductase